MNNVLVSGSSGFLGSAIVQSYLFSSSFNGNIVTINRDGIPFQGTKSLRGDITDYNFIRRVISDEEISTIYHCAANSIVRHCANDPMSAYENTVLGTVKLLEAVRTVGMPHIKSIVISTSDKAMGHSPSPYTEQSPLLPKYTYESTKSCQDIVAQNYFHNYGLPINIMRCSNIYGPGDPNLSRIVPNTIRRLNNDQSPILHSGVANYIREFIHVGDVSNAFKLVSDEAPRGEIYCVGGTGKIKIYDLVELIKKLMGKEHIETEIVEKDVLFKEIDEQWIDSSKLQTLGWKPWYSLEEGLRHTINWYTKYGTR